MNFMEFARGRFSVKKFSSRPVEAEKLTMILKAGNLAPTAKNNQPQRIYVLQSKETLDKIRSLTPCTYGAETVLLVAYDETEEWHNPLEPGIHSGVEDASIVATHMMLEAEEQGLHSCWINFFANQAVEDAFNLPKQEHVVLLLLIGYGEEGTGPLPPHSSKKRLEETVHYL